MDPIMRAAKVFLAEAEAFWRSVPGRILPMIAEPRERGSVVKALRLQELALESRRPLFLHEEPFTEARAYFDGLAEAVRRDYEQLREGAAEEGVTLPRLSVSDEDAGRSSELITRAALVMDRAAGLLSDRFEGVCLALVPNQIVDAPGWRESIATLDRVRLPSRVRIAVFAPPGGPLQDMLNPKGAHLRIEEDELRDHLRGMDRTTSDAPEATMKLRTLLLDAAERTAASEYATAAELYCEARRWCAANARHVEEAMVLMALGGTCLAAGAEELGIKSYRRAAEIAQAEEAWPIVCQAWLGVGGVYLAGRSYTAAAVAYRAAAQAAKRADVVQLLIEALRMAGTCLLLAGSEEGAIFAWQEAVSVVRDLGAREQGGSTLAEVKAALLALLKRHGLGQQVAHVQSLVAC